MIDSQKCFYAYSMFLCLFSRTHVLQNRCIVIRLLQNKTVCFTHELGHSQSPALFCTLPPGGPFQPIPPRGPPRGGKPPLSPPLPIPVGIQNKATITIQKHPPAEGFLLAWEFIIPPRSIPGPPLIGIPPLIPPIMGFRRAIETFNLRPWNSLPEVWAAG